MIMVNNSGLDRRVKKKHLKQLADFRTQTLRPSPRLHTLFFELTTKCNEHCLHCGSNCGDAPETGALTTGEYIQFIDKVYDSFRDEEHGLPGIAITGGEPLLREDFFEITAHLKEKGFGWGMTSNGTLITADIAKKLADTGMRTISVSLDGLKEDHEWFRCSPGSYEKTMTGIKNLLDTGSFDHVQITTVVNHRNISSLYDMYEEFKKTGVRSWRVINIEPIGRARNNPELQLTKEEYRQLFDFIAKNRFRDKMEVCYGCSHFLGIDYEREVRRWYFLCNAGVYTASIMYNGDITSCLDIERRPELVQGNIRRDDFKEVWKNGFKIYRTDYRKAGKCAKCKYYKYCAGDAFHTWNFDEMQPNLCMRGILFE